MPRPNMVAVTNSQGEISMRSLFFFMLAATLMLSQTAFAQSDLDGYTPMLAGVPADPDTAYVRAMALQSDGKLLIGGEFQTVNGVACPGLCRLNVDGNVDSTFEDFPHYDQT